MADGKAKIEDVNGKGIRCQCGEFKAFGARGIAQLAMGHAVGRNCQCGRYVEAKQVGNHYEISREFIGHIFESGMKALED